MQQTLTVTTSKRLELIDITRQVASVVAASKVREGLCTLFARHATAALIINENADPGFRQDVLSLLDKLIPEGVWEHDKVDDNGAAHLRGHPARALSGDPGEGREAPARHLAGN